MRVVDLSVGTADSAGVFSAVVPMMARSWRGGRVVVDVIADMGAVGPPPAGKSEDREIDGVGGRCESEYPCLCLFRCFPLTFSFQEMFKKSYVGG